MKLCLYRWACLLLLFSVAGCTTPELTETPAAEFAAEELYPVRHSGFEEAYVARGANLPGYAEIEFARFSSAEVQVTQTTVAGTTRSDWQMTAEKEQRLDAIWRQATARAFADYPVAGEGKLRITAELTKVEPRRSASTATTAAGGMVSGTSDVVEVSVEIRIFDASTGQLLSVVRDKRQIASLQWGRAAGADLVNLLNSWASLLHTRVRGR